MMRYPALLLSVLSVFVLSTGCANKPTEQSVRPEQVLDAKVLYAQNCAACHGAEGKQGAAQSLNYPLYLAYIPKKDLVNVIAHGQAANGMPAYLTSEGGSMNEQQIGILTDYIESWAKPVDLHGTPMPPYNSPSMAGDAGNGGKLFAQSCAPCHGPKGKVGMVSTPSYLALVSNEYLRTSIVVGNPERGMPNWQSLKGGKPLADGDIADLVAYLASQRPDNTDAQMKRSENK